MILGQEYKLRHLHTLYYIHHMSCSDPEKLFSKILPPTSHCRIGNQMVNDNDVDLKGYLYNDLDYGLIVYKIDIKNLNMIK